MSIDLPACCSEPIIMCGICYFCFKFKQMINAYKREQERGCNCRSSKCIKQYCDCFTAGLPCTKNCNCLDCHNGLAHPSAHPTFTKIVKKQFGKGERGCACRKTGCVKKYCECYQSGSRCHSSCKCSGCQNNDLMANKRIVTQLRTVPPQDSLHNTDKLYPVYLSQNSQQVNSIITAYNPLGLGDAWLEFCGLSLLKASSSGGKQAIIEEMSAILENLRNMSQVKQEEENSLCFAAKKDQIDQQQPMPASQGKYITPFSHINSQWQIPEQRVKIQNEQQNKNNPDSQPQISLISDNGEMVDEGVGQPSR